MKTKLTLNLVWMALISASAIGAERPGFVSSERLAAGNYQLDVARLSKPVTIKAVRSQQLKPGQTCHVHLDSIRQAIDRQIAEGKLNVTVSAADKPNEAQIHMRARINSEGGFECFGDGSTCLIVVTIPPETELRKL